MNRLVIHMGTVALLSFMECNFNVHSGLNLNIGDRTDHVLASLKVNDALIYAHFIAVPCLGALTAWRLSGRNAKNFGWHADRPLGFDLLFFGALDQSAAYCLYTLHIS